MEFYDSMKMDEQKVAEPKDIMSKLMEERRKLIVGHFGDPKQDKQKIEESLTPSHYAISLSGEPTMYPKLPGLIKYLKSLEATKSIFLVTNGQEPEMIQRLADEDALPTQLYLSTNASDYNSFLKINRPKYDDSWERWNRTLEMLAELDTRTVLRVTLIKDWNDSEEMMSGFTSIFEKSNAHFVEMKSYMHIGRSTNRLEYENMVDMNDIRSFSEQITKSSDRFEVMDESEISRIVVLQNKKRFTERYLSAYA
tara:strand:+ start:115 stop:873 length:759 start_codon:yes stop_codon:yes gene_type:complete